jgi:hypothetical protein
MNRRKLVPVLCTTVAVVALTLALPASALAGRGNGPVGVIYVTSQDLYYDTIGLGDLPPHGPFQMLIVDLDSDGNIVSAITDYGPGDPEYVGGRWEAWIYDSNGDLVAIRYFECPLLPPGREEP